MRRTGVKRRRRSLREILGDRALMAGFLFSVVVHAVVIFWVPFPIDSVPLKKRRLMVAHLVRLPAAQESPAEERTGADEAREAAPAAGKKSETDSPHVEDESPAAEKGVGVSARVSSAARGVKVAARYALRIAGTGGTGMAWAAVPHSPPAAAGRAGLNVSRPGPVPGEHADALDQIRRMIDSKKTYPRIARRNGWEGKVLVEISLAEGGALEDVQIVNASGYGILDAATVKAVRRAGPFPPIEGKVRVPVTYRLAP